MYNDFSDPTHVMEYIIFLFVPNFQLALHNIYITQNDNHNSYSGSVTCIDFMGLSLIIAEKSISGDRGQGFQDL
ncbi:hypothetical protein NQ314_004472 [Rhamnusium bicolor]|uniref:Uncharacterized protein n=1 Tax=Rhamnusium bicolor TaxID=1586634 RepID=A0AAV8ZL89_9CUCU|nr:hypothetical protein NQ314_004472 [Rhamnusium bicolor]